MRNIFKSVVQLCACMYVVCVLALATGDAEEGSAVPTLAQWKQLEQQSERMKIGLVTFRDLVNQDKQEITALTKEVSHLL